VSRRATLEFERNFKRNSWNSNKKMEFEMFCLNTNFKENSGPRKTNKFIFFSIRNSQFANKIRVCFVLIELIFSAPFNRL